MNARVREQWPQWVTGSKISNKRTTQTQTQVRAQVQAQTQQRARGLSSAIANPQSALNVAMTLLTIWPECPMPNYRSEIHHKWHGRIDDTKRGRIKPPRSGAERRGAQRIITGGAKYSREPKVINGGTEPIIITIAIAIAMPSFT
ncbi:GL23241 [Drosophila persimilis]|uniref:GL23241 n=1 Tax=Drosophila persimilis TaxID=7234 RepID=B4HBK5_DROPE|nr:GL23241 [Drosophila persimilis]